MELVTGLTAIENKGRKTEEKENKGRKTEEKTHKENDKKIFKKLKIKKGKDRR